MRKTGKFCCVAYVESESGVLPLNYAPMWGVLYIIMRHLQSIFLFDLVVILHAIFCEADRHFRLDWRYIFWGNFSK